MGRKEQRDMCVLLVEGVCLFDCAFSCLHRGKTPKMGRLNKNSLPSGGINSDLKPPVAFTLSLLLLLLLPCFLFRKRVATAQRFFSSLLLTCKQIVMELSLKGVPVSRKSTCSAAFWKKKGEKKASGLTGWGKKNFLAPYYQVNRCGAGSSNRAGFSSASRPMLPSFFSSSSSSPLP